MVSLSMNFIERRCKKHANISEKNLKYIDGANLFLISLFREMK